MVQCVYYCIGRELSLSEEEEERKKERKKERDKRKKYKPVYMSGVLCIPWGLPLDLTEGFPGFPSLDHVECISSFSEVWRRAGIIIF